MVTKVQLLNSFIEEYELEMIEDFNKLRGLVSLKSLNFSAFENALKQISPDIKPSKVEKMFKNLQVSEKTKNVSPEGFCISVLKNKIGGYGIGMFGKNYLDLNSLSLA